MPLAGTFQGSRLAEARRKKGLSQTQLAAKIGAHVTSISDWERGRNQPSSRHLATLTSELGVDAAHLYGSDDEDEDRMRRAIAELVARGGNDDIAADLMSALSRDRDAVWS